MGRQIESDFGETMNHPWHDHPLRKKPDEGKPFKCSGCRELGFGPRHRCVKNNCHFLLDAVCFKALLEGGSRKHRFMGNCEFKFLREPPGWADRPFCDACGWKIQGFLYHHKHRNEHNLHPGCMNLEGTKSDSNNGMEMILKDKMPSNSRCLKCKRKNDLKVATKGPFRGWSYVSSCGYYSYHVYCMKKLDLDNWKFRRGYFNGNVASCSSSSSSTEKSLVITSAASSLALAETISSPSSPAPTTSYFTCKRFFQLAIIFFCLGIAIRYAPEDPIPMFKALIEVVLKIL